jgi:hypothetical protein
VFETIVFRIFVKDIADQQKYLENLQKLKQKKLFSNTPGNTLVLTPEPDLSFCNFDVK